jgi:hypothetical protein
METPRQPFESASGGSDAKEAQPSALRGANADPDDSDLPVLPRRRLRDGIGLTLAIILTIVSSGIAFLGTCTAVTVLLAGPGDEQTIFALLIGLGFGALAVYGTICFFKNRI